MILDRIDNAESYSVLNRGFAQAFEFLQRSDLMTLPADQYPLDGERLFAIVAKETARSREEARLETHQRYIDIHLVLAGIETMGWRPESACQQPTAEYDHQSDLRFFNDEPDCWLTAKPGVFAIFFPEDGHMPLIGSGSIHKVIVKVAVNQPSVQ